MDDALTVERPGRISRHLNGFKGSDSSDLESACAESSRSITLNKKTLKMTKFLFKKHHYIVVILSNRMQPITN
jgi:hypothetical protein